MFEAIRLVAREIKSCGGIKAKIAVLLYRLATLYRSRNPLWKICGIPFVILNIVINECLFCIELPWRARIGYGLKLYHPHCIVINRGNGHRPELHPAPGRHDWQRDRQSGP
ncbi:serine acetyltransferase [Klebsiella michiganensis]|uniref:Serine acetyltransferase n=1 Tax=Klebsiella michiganensis TaxID=1134687 RepID=A0A7H4N6W5_9ENTR|nr:serine acetyltransferase [Klebsiella michiganensis]